MDLRELYGAGFERHPWEVARAHYFRALLAGQGLLGRPLRVLDVGAGDGYLAGQLLEAVPGGSEVVCLDPHYSDEHLQRFAAASGPGVSFVRGSPAGQFDLLLFLDVLEHIADDRGFLARSVADYLVPDGSVLISVPAWMSLFSKHDVFVGHHRRYRPAQLRQVIAETGLQVVVSGGMFHSLLGARAAQKLDELRRGVRSRPSIDGVAAGSDGAAAAAAADQAGVGQWRKGRWVTGAITSFLSLDGWLSLRFARAGLDLPGLSAWALCRKR